MAAAAKPEDGVIVEGTQGAFNVSELALPDVKLAGEAMSSGDETHEEVFRVRSKLYRFAKDVMGNEGLQERALGDIRVLKDPETGLQRLLMREEKMGYVRLHMYADPTRSIVREMGWP